ncbi:hypothetical protein [Polymorphobacter fuscus]|uniref:DUF2306 domain-containing protein n=1 Tax=Sandarakinorhabdus fusca TaxID=1439888 RepID=A0A7C9GVU9_9SPHN|nr:hypothetical protein [Polymorphobacter fuscus]KAB7646549.1 hypothetical protein F9290_11080 [Polymorphobacter fuscus]MQT17798.1 hypothetical protein [Polymorphobacter fuscus]NJC09653.1 hypothetical protein [Polymorphobacter fuscus]
MPWLFELVLAAHVGAGIVALVTFWGAVLTAKGGNAHRRWGHVFAGAIRTAGWMALGMGTLSLFWPLAMHPGLTDAALYRGLFGWMMLYLALLTMSMTRYGLMMVANKRNHPANRHWTMVALQLLVLAAAVNCAWQGVVLRQPLMIGVSIIGFGTVLTYLWYMFRPAPGRTDYIPEHLKAMVATGIAAYTAFLSVGLVELFPQHAFNPVIWAVPTVIGVGIIAWYLRQQQGAARRPVTGGTPSGA